MGGDGGDLGGGVSCLGERADFLRFREIVGRDDGVEEMRFLGFEVD